MAVLVRTGLVTTEQTVDVEVEIDLDLKGEVADAIPSADTTTLYRVTGLGLDVLESVQEADQGT